jgi:hypothetical protein
MKLPKRLPYEIAIIASLILGSCAGPGLSEKQRDEVGDIAEASVSDSDAMVSVRDRLDRIEQRLDMQ